MNMCLHFVDPQHSLPEHRSDPRIMENYIVVAAYPAHYPIGPFNGFAQALSLTPPVLPQVEE